MDGKRQEKGGTNTYKSAIVSSFLFRALLNDLTELFQVGLRSGLEHHLGRLG